MTTYLLISMLVGCSGDGGSAPQQVVSNDALVVADEAAAPTATGIEQVLEENSDFIAQCYRNELRQRPTLAGRLVLEWVVEGGSATGGQVVSEEFGEANVEALALCILESSRTWTFPAGDGAVRYPLTFTPRG